jgi:hypothetical protein
VQIFHRSAPAGNTPPVGLGLLLPDLYLVAAFAPAALEGPVRWLLPAPPAGVTTHT